jgi:hypothetical protein
MQHLAALLFADQIESVLTQGGREAVRERLAELRACPGREGPDR